MTAEKHKMETESLFLVKRDYRGRLTKSVHCSTIGRRGIRQIASWLLRSLVTVEWKPQLSFKTIFFHFPLCTHNKSHDRQRSLPCSRSLDLFSHSLSSALDIVDLFPLTPLFFEIFMSKPVLVFY